MDSAYAMKVFNKFSIIFSVLTFILYYADKQSTLPTLFIYVCVSAVVSLIIILKNREHKFAIIFLPLILFPMILVKNIWEAGFVIVVII